MLMIPAFSAGDLISKVNGEIYGANKAVKDKNNNQKILETEVANLLCNYKDLLLAGHFCIFDKENHVDILPISTFINLHIEIILLLEATYETIRHNLKMRDKKDYSVAQIKQLVESERLMSNKVSRIIKCPLIIHRMSFDKSDTELCCNSIMRYCKLQGKG